MPQLLAEASVQLRSVDTEVLEIDQALGRILDEPIIADRDHPPADVAAMDGFAVQVADLCQHPIPVNAAAFAGQPTCALKDGYAMRIATGAIVPHRADAVIRSEWCVETSDGVLVDVDRSITPGNDIRRRAENCQAGEVIARAGQRVTPAVIAAAKAFGKSGIRVYGRLRVAVIATGDELVDSDLPPRDHQTRESNATSIAAMLSARSWMRLSSVTHVADQTPTVMRAIESALASSDAVVLTGGTCRSERDSVRSAIEQLRLEVMFDGVPIRPGRPTIGATAAPGKLVLALPGNPIAALLAARVVGLPLLSAMSGNSASEVGLRVSVQGRPSSADVTRLELGRISEDGTVHVIPSHGSADIPAAVQSDGVLVFDEPSGQNAIFLQW